MAVLTENQQKWVDALRSGAYAQTKLILRKGDDYCCLGVVCDVSGVSEWRVPEEGGDYLYLGVRNSLPDRVARWLGGTRLDLGEMAELRTRNGTGETGTLEWLVFERLNDNLGLTFDQIADLVEYFGLKMDTTDIEDNEINLEDY